MPSTHPLPTSIDALTPEWLTAALREGGLKDVTVTGAQSTVIGEGVGFIGQVARLELTCAPPVAGAPSSIVAKIPSSDPGARMIGVAFGLYEREVRFYSELSHQAGLPAPKCYFAAYDAAAGQAVVLLEDLSEGAFGDQVAGATPGQAEIAVDALGKFHAEWWESPRFADMPWLIPSIETLRAPILMMYEASWRPAIERLGHLFTPEMIEVIPEMGKRTMSAFDALATVPLTLGHGDYRPDNIFFGVPGSGRPLVVCDWQGPGKAPGITDIAYFIAGSMEPDDRRAHEDELLRRYHNLLLEGGVRDFSFETLKEQYRGYFALTLAGAVVLGGNLPDGNERGRIMIEKTVQRFVTAMTDLDSLGLLPAL
jgi:hypothetical protein